MPLPLVALAGVVLDLFIIGSDFLVSPEESQINVFLNFEAGMDFGQFLADTWLIWLFIVSVFWFFVALANPAPSARRRRR